MLKRLIKLERSFQDKFSAVSTILKQFDSRLKQLIAQTHDVEDLRSLLEEQQMLQSFMSKLGSISQKIQASQEGANWLDDNREELVKYAENCVFGQDLKLGVVSVSRNVVDVFSRDLDSYLLWISHHMRSGTTPREMWEGLIILPLPAEIYVKGFSSIKNEKILDSIKISPRAKNMLRTYIDRFLIARDFTKDRCKP